MYKSWTKRFARKIWKSPLALAVTAGILAGAGFMSSAFAAQSVDGTVTFDTTITGTTADTEYTSNPDLVSASIGTNIGAKYSTYIFNNDNAAHTIQIGGIHVENQYLNVNLLVKGDNSTLKVADGISSYMHDGLNVNADNIIINADNKEGVFADGATINLNGDVTINATGDNGKGLVAYLESIKADGNASGTYSTASLKVKGTAKIDTVNHAVQASGADINIDDLVDIHSSNGVAVRAMAYRAYYSDSYSEERMANVNIVGGKIAADKYDAIHNEGSNVYLNSDGANSLEVKGNVVMLDRNGHVANTIMKLTDADSSWTGGLFTTNYNAAFTIDQANNMQLTLQNGGTWNNVGESFNTVEGDEALSLFDYTSTIRSLTGGSSAETAGLIFQNTSRDLDIKNYSGYTKVFYDHTNDGTTISDFTGGDIIVNSAAEGAHIDMITDAEGINRSNTYQVNTVLNNLAQKLVYSGAIIAVDAETGKEIAAENNLYGQAIIAENLTSSSQAVAMNKISFDSETGRGYLGNYISQLVTEFTTPLTGVAASDKVYSDAYVLQETGEYRFSKDSSITVSGKDAAAIALAKNPATIIAGGTNLTLNVNDGQGIAAGITNKVNDTTKIHADQINVNVTSAESAGGIYQTAGKTIIDSDLNLAITSTAAAGSSAKTIGVYAEKGSMTINGDVNVELANNGIGWEYYGSHGIYATSQYGATPGADIVVNGKVTFKGEGSGLTANMGGSSVTVDSVDIAINKDNDRGYAAIRAENGTVNVNVERDESGAIVGGAGNVVNIKGNVGLGDGAVYFQDVLGTESALNLAMNTADSTLQGVIFNQYGAEGVIGSGRDSSGNDVSVKFTGDSNLWLQNGATWTNEQYGSLDEPNYGGMKFAGSYVSNFVGGNDIYTAGNIFQKDSNPLTIDNYSGITKVYYAHTGDGTASDHYAAGDTIVNHAAGGSQIYMLTDNSNITVEDRSQVNKVLNALAGKLVYTGFVDGEDDLQGMVGIAEGLTTYSNIKIVKGITFGDDGRGSFDTGESASGVYASPITGTDSDEEYIMAGVTRDYTEYKFDPLDYESKLVTIGSGEEAGIQFKSGKDISIYAPMLDLEVDGGITAERDAANPWTGSYLVIDTINEEGASGKVIIHKKTGDAINATADVRIYGQAEITSGGNGLVANITGTNSGSIEITKGTAIKADNYGILAEGGSVTLDSSNNNIVAKGDAIHAVSVEVNPEGTAYKTGGWVYVEGGHIESTEGNAIYSNAGTIYINAGGDHTTTMKGDVVAENGSQINIKLTDADSLWKGHLSNTDSNVELTLTNDAQWLNGDGAMSINSLTGAEALDSAANIFRGAGVLTIDYLNGAMNFYYAHENDGDKVEDYDAYGDTIIKSAEAGSVVKLITDKNDNFDIDKINSYKDVLDALAHKLVYSGFASGERNLNGYVAIAEGLTSSSAELTVNTITFSNTGRGSYIEVHENGITGTDEDTRYNEKDEVNGDYSTYEFGSQNGVNMVIPNVMLQVVDKPLDVTINSVEALDFKEKVYVSPDNTVTINAPKGININNGWINAIDNAGGKIVLNGAVNVYTAAKGLVADTVVKTEAQDQLNRAGVIDIKENVNITSYGESVFANGGTINIDKGGKFSTLYGDYPDAMTVTSDTIVAMEKVVTPYGDASEAELYQGVVNIKGDADNRINIQSNSNALYSEGGIININQDNAATVIMTGFIAGHASENGTAPEFNVNLTNENSRWEGRIRVDDKAQVNLTLQDGATWATYRYYQADNNTPQLYLNNRVSNFVGSTGDQKAGIIRMTDYIDLNLENYSGNTIVYYGHLMGYDGTEKWHYEDGVQKADVHVGKATKGSVITVMTDKDDINLNNQEQVNKVLNTLASFLVYDGYVKGERNLTGQVAIAQSLTASDMWAVLPEAEKMSFDEATGRGYYVGVLPGVYNSAITGTSADTEYSDKGVSTETAYDWDNNKEYYLYNNYVFTENNNGKVVVPAIAVGNYYKTMNIKAEGLNLAVDGGISINRSNNVTIDSSAVTINTSKDKAITSLAGSLGIKGDLTINGTGKGIVAERSYNGNDTSQAADQAYVTIDGKTVIATTGTAIEAIGADINLKDEASLSANSDTVIVKVGEGKLSDYWYQPKVSVLNMVGGSITATNGNALIVEGGTANLNADGGKDLSITGDITLKTGITADDYGYEYGTQSFGSTANIKLDTSDSSWTGSLMNDGNTMNLTLQNGATWTDAATESTLSNTVNTFTGGTDAATAGNIYRNDARDLTINNYSGYTNIFYAHDENDATQFAAGDTIIKSADTGSRVTVITDSTNVNLDNHDLVTSVLNALAGKLYYTGYDSALDKDAQNLTGSVAIAQGLTTSDRFIRQEEIVFNPYTGQGTFGHTGDFIPPSQEVTEFTQAITGNGQDVDNQYYKGGVLQESGSYVFTKDSTITTNSAAINTSKDVNIDASGKKLSVVTNADRGINNAGGTLNITGDLNLKVNGSGTTAGIYADKDATTNIAGDVTIAATTAKGDTNGIWGIAANASGSKIVVDGNVTIKGADGGYGITNEDSSLGFSGSVSKSKAGIMSDKGEITITGNVDLKTDGHGVATAWSGASVIDILGGGTISVNKDITQNSSKANGNYALITSGGGHITLNYDKDAGAVGNNKVVLEGNLGMTRPDKIDTDTSITLGLTTSDSLWTGIMHDEFAGTDKADVATSTLYLQNGATWNNEQWGDTYHSEATGSIWDNFIGGESAGKAGNIYQKDSKAITFGNYSGYTNIYYAHGAEDPTTIIGGDTIINKATEGSVVTLITDQNGITTSDAEQVASVMNALAGKLVYNDFAANAGNLTGYVKLAEKLTGSSAELLLGDITYDENGRGKYTGTGEVEDPYTPIAPITGQTTIYKDSIIKTENASAISFGGTSTITATGLKLVADVETTDGISAVSMSKTSGSALRGTINADSLTVKYATANHGSAIDLVGDLDTNFNTQVTVKAEAEAGKTLNGIYVHASGSKYPWVYMNGDIVMNNNGEYGVTNGNTAVDGLTSNYAVTGILVDGGGKNTRFYVGKSNGYNVDLLIDGTGVVATNSSDVQFKGGGSIEVNRAPVAGIYNYALEALNNASISFGNADSIKGNLAAFNGGKVSLGLTKETASWTGVMHDANGTSSVTLKNGATWNNELWGPTYDAAGEFQGSVVDNFYGGTADTAGNIYQKDSKQLTLSNYSGWTNIYYAHTADAPMTMLGGDTVINSASADSGVTMITENNGVTVANAALVMNSLAQKLVYKGTAGNLTGKLSIAEGLTTGGITATGNIAFGSDGRGSYAAISTTSAESRIMLAAEGEVEGEDPITPVEPEAITTPLVAKGEEKTIEGKVDIKLTEAGDAITAKGTATAPGVVNVMGGGKIYAKDGNAVYAESGTVNLNPAGGNELIIKGDVVLKGISEGDTTAPASAYIVLDTATSSWQGNLYNNGAASAAVVLQNGAIWNNRNENREEELGITGHRVSSFTGGTTAETAGYFFQNNTQDMVFDQYSGYTKVFFGHLNDGSAAEDYTAGNLIINNAAAGSGITLITNQSYNIDVKDDEQVNKILNSLAGKLFYNGYADGERNLVADVQIAESLTGSSAYLTGGVLNFNSSGQGYYGKQVHVAGIYTTDITGSTADAEFVNAGVTKDFKTYNFTDSVEGEETSKVILQGIKVAGDTGNNKDEKDVTINIFADQAELNDSINVGYRGTVELKADSVTIKGVENTAIDNYGGTLTVKGNVEISDVANGIHTSSKAEVAGAEYIGTVDIKGQAKITSEGTAIATEGGEVSVGAGSSITSTNGDAIVAQGQRLFSMQVGYYDKEVAGIVNVAGGTISAAKGNAINVAGGQVYVNENGGNDTKITGNILVAKDTTYVGTQTEDTPQQSIVDITLDTKDSTWNGSLSVAEGQVMNLTLQNGAIWTDAVSELAGNTISNLVGGTSSDTAGTIRRNDTRDLTITKYSGWTNIYYEHDEKDATKMIGGDTVIKTAAEGSGINMITGSNGVNTNDKEQVTAVLSALANKLFYEEASEQKTEENGAEAVMFAAANEEDNTANTFKLQAKALIAEGLTVSSKVASGTVNFKTEKDGQGFVTIDDVVIGGDPVVPPVDGEHDPLDKVEIVTGGEPVTMRAIKSSMAAATMMWRSENNDLMKRMGDLRVLEGERGLWAKYYSGKQEMDAQDTNFSEKYKAYQIGYDTKVNDNWTVGAALSYNDGTSSTSNVADGVTGAWANGHGEQKNISLGVYGSWKAKDGQYADIIVKASRLDNDYNLKFWNGIKTFNIDGDYKTWGTSISAEYGKRFEGDKGTYFEPSAELTYGHMAGKSYSASTDYYGATMYMDQDSFDTLVGRIGLRVGQKLENGSYFAKLALAHEFSGEFDTRYNVDGADHNKTHLDFGDTWYELQIGGTAKLSANSMLYADFQRSFGGDVTEKWRVDAGLRFTF